MKYLLSFSTGVIAIIFGYLFSSDELRPEFIGGGYFIIIGAGIALLFEAIVNRERVKFILKCKSLAFNNQNIRFSMSYLYRIKVKNKYLLVKNSNYGHYQLVGGKYKRLIETQSYLKNNFDAMDDLKFPNEGLTKNDFAIFIPASKAVKFIDWFNNQKDREISHWREFYEELVKTKVVTQEKFPYVSYNYVGTVTTPIHKNNGWDCPQVLQYDILDLIPTKEQEIELLNLLNDGDRDYHKWADRELINNLGHDNRQKKQLYRIGDHTKWALNMKWSKN